LFMGAFVSAFMVAVAGMMVYVQGAAFLGTGFIMDLRNALVEMQGRQMEAFVWLAAAPTLLILSGMLIASKYLVH